MKRILALCLVSLSGCFELSLPGVPVPPGSGALQGSIVHAEPGQTALRPAIGATVELWGAQVPVDEVAAAAGTIGYELLCAVAPRVPMHVVAD